MKKLLALCFFTLTFAFQAQQNPVHWVASYKSTSATEGELIITANIDNNWHTYSMRDNDAGPIPTAFTFPASKDYELVGKTEEWGAHEEFDNAFGAKIYVFNTKAEFKQKIKLKAKPGFTLPFKVDYMCCNDRTCLPPKTVELSVKVQ